MHTHTWRDEDETLSGGNRAEQGPEHNLSITMSGGQPASENGAI